MSTKSKIKMSHNKKKIKARIINIKVQKANHEAVMRTAVMIHHIHHQK